MIVHGAEATRSPGRLNEWVRTCALTDIPRLGARVIHRPGMDSIALFRTGDDRVFAIADRCPHRGGPLSQGIVYGNRVACPLHGWSIDLARGEAVAPDAGCVERFSIEVDEGDVWLRRADLLGTALPPRS